MSEQTMKQLNEIRNVLHTLIETTDHLTTLAKAEELEQSVYIFASLIEGTEAVFKVLPTLEIDVVNHMEKTEQALLVISKALENEALAVVSEVAKATLRPELVAMAEESQTVLQNM